MRWLGVILLLAACSLSAQTSAVPKLQYRSVPDFLQLPADLYFGEVTGVAVNSKGHIFVFSRGNTTGPAYGAAAAQLLEFGSDGKFLREIGHNLYAWSYAHTVKIDPQDYGMKVPYFSIDVPLVLYAASNGNSADKAANLKKMARLLLHEDYRERNR